MKDDPLGPIFARTSCRAFRTDPVPDDHLDRLLESTRHSPSAGNRQPWRFLVVRTKEDRAALARAAYDQEFLVEAPILIVICADTERSATRYGDRGRTLYVIQDTAAATENLLIAATALGYGSCWVGAFDEGEVSRTLGIPSELRPIAMVPIGKPAEQTSSPRRRPIEEIIEKR